MFVLVMLCCMYGEELQRTSLKACERSIVMIGDGRHN